MEEGDAKSTKRVALVSLAQRPRSNITRTDCCQGFRLFHIGLCVFMCVTAVFSLMSDNDISLIPESPTLQLTSFNSIFAEDTDSIFVAIYVFIFAVHDSVQAVDCTKGRRHRSYSSSSK